MHIPDGYLSPETAAAMYVAAAPLWLRATQKIKSMLNSRTVPLLALFSAFSFIIMMFNVPLPGGTTGHAVGATIIAIVLGPWAALLAVSIALLIQALFFGDGGILAYGANVFNMGILMSFVGYYLYRWLSANTPINSPRRAAAGAIAGYVAINVSALATGIELGLQPLLFHDAAGHALYFPYGLQVAIPSMLIGHLTVAGVVEGVVTALIVVWLQRSNPELLDLTGAVTENISRTLRYGWIVLIGLVILTPLGLLAPGTAWGEWGRQELASLGLGYIPAGFDRFSNIWSAPLSGYDIPALNNPTVTYIISALVGVGLVVAILFALSWILGRIGKPYQTQEHREHLETTIGVDATTAAKRTKRRGPGFLEKTLAGISETLEHTLFAEEIARQPGFLQQLDPRTKLVGVLALLIAVSFSHNLLVLVSLYLLTLPAAYASRVPMGFFLKRVWVLMPFFTGIIALPALFNIFTPGPALLTFVTTPQFTLSITLPGVITAAFLLLRVGTSVSIGVLLILTTRWNSLLKALRVLHVPQAFVLILGMTYRYIYVLLHAMNDMFLARRSRLVGRVSGSEDRQWLTASMAILLSKSYRLSEEVFLAMQSRGFRGDVLIMENVHWRRSDTLWLAIYLGVSAIAIVLGRA